MSVFGEIIIMFETNKHVDKAGKPYWLASELADAMDYENFADFQKIIDRAMLSDNKKALDSACLFKEITNYNTLGKRKPFKDYKLTYGACYLLMRSFDGREANKGRIYFSKDTVFEEIMERSEDISYTKQRIAIRDEISEKHKIVSKIAAGMGIVATPDFGRFNNSRYEGLYGGLKSKEIAEHKNMPLKKGESPLDYMSRKELMLNLNVLRGIEEELSQELDKNITNIAEYAIRLSASVARGVRKTIIESGGVLPENIRPADKSITEVKNEVSRKV